MNETTIKPLPFKPGDWVSDGSDRVATVRRVYWGYPDENEVLLDLIMYDWEGDRLGRVSPSMGGPRSFEPACSADGWRRVNKPTFPMEPKWVADPERPGVKVSRYWAGKTLPPANWVPRQRRARMPAKFVLPTPDPELDRLREALKQIADGHNDPRTLAKEVLGLQPVDNDDSGS